MSWLQKIMALRPSERLDPRDGMAVTVDTWKAAHDYHDNLLRAALLTISGSGIIEGLEVTLDNNDPYLIHVSNGVAIDPDGHLLVFAARPIDIRENKIDGVVSILLRYERAPLLADQRSDSYLSESCRLITESKDATSGKSAVEIVRVDRTANNAHVKIAANPANPGKDELDLRYRLAIGPKPLPIDTKVPLYLAVVKVGDVPKIHMQGWRTLVSEVSYTTSRPIFTREYDSLPTPAELQTFDLICLTGRDNFDLDENRKKALIAYVEEGGILFYESCRNGLSSIPTADATFQKWMNDTGRQLQEVPPDDPLRLTPYFFPKLPRGYADPAQREYKITRAKGKGTVLFCNVDCGCAFSGRLANVSQPTRSDLRETFEWGHNLIALAGRRIR